MAPVLLDNRGLLKVAISIVLVIILVFGGGFITGYQKAVVQQLALTQNRGIELPLVGVEQAESLVLALAPKLPAIEEAGALIDVDNPDNALHQPMVETQAKGLDVSSIVDNSTLAVISKDAKTSGFNSLIPFVANDAIEDKKTKRPVISSDKKGKSEKSDITQVDTLQKHQSGRVKNTDISSALIEVSKLNARYSIQVGMYGQRVNASNLVKMLETQGLDAYISEYLNKTQQIRYNVRFGYFENKRAALKGLKYYTDNMDGKGYLVRFKQIMHAENNRSATSVPTDKTAEF